MDPSLLSSRLIIARPSIQQILSTSGTVGLSYGIIHRGAIVHTDNFGFRDHFQKLPMTLETMMPICSLTKGLLTSALGLLVEEGKLEWDARVSDLLSDLCAVFVIAGRKRDTEGFPVHEIGHRAV
jgi:CubicO group peptidase (beta-lactamase class C family)